MSCYFAFHHPIMEMQRGDETMIRTMQTVIQLLIALAAMILLGVSIAGRMQSNWPLCGALGCSIAVNVLNILRTKKQKEKENGSDENRKFY